MEGIAKAFILATCLLSLGLSADLRVSPATGPGAPPDSVRSGSLFEPEQDAAILTSLDLIYRADYAGADSVLAALPDGPARGYFRGLTAINRFNDLGDTVALRAAGEFWARLDRAGDSSASFVRWDPNYPLYRGLAELQLSYVASLTGGRIQSARLGRKAVGHLRPLARFAEAEAALALYDYYKADLLQGVEWMPFVKADREAPLRRLEASIPRSRYLREILQTSLQWIYYDLGRYDRGSGPITGFLARYPRNRLYRQMQADFRYRRGDLDSARRIHEDLVLEYRGLARIYPHPPYLPLGYLSSVGNLAKINAAQNRREALQSQLAIWHSPEYGGMMKWLPGSLRREVDSLKK
ncbi:MAG: hypothetical protein JWP91_1118 [Fibrobacteres bacterium]|nr:hypothetical protein [Fibrobacterota bacterium]